MSDRSTDTRLGILGCAGRMGRMLIAAGNAADGVRIAAGIDRPGSPWLNTDLGVLAGLAPLGVVAGDDPAALFDASDVVIDFTAPAATVANARAALAHGKALVVGTTGLAPADEAVLREAAQHVPIVYAANYSLGVNLLRALVRRAAAVLGPEFDIEILEMHHRMKVDAPSGTALALGRAAAAGRGVALEDVWVKSRDGHTGAREEGTIGFATLRGGDVPGDHQVLFAGPGERIELGHRASGREIFARGAVRAARWVAGRAPGLYSMDDVLGLPTA